MKTYTTMQGDMWDGIAYKQMGDTDYADRLMAANRAYLNTYIFPAGAELVIPEVEAPVNTQAPPWKQVSA